MIGYILLITTAIVISTIVYQWVKTYVPTDPIECPEGVSIFVKESRYNCENKELNLTLKNNGRFNIGGYLIHATTSPGQELASVDLSQYTESGEGKGAVLFSFLDNSMKPNNEIKNVFDLNDLNFSQIYSVEIIPMRYQNKNRVNCADARVKETLNCLEGVGSVCGNGIIETGEQCDDGNTANSDGCSSTCQIESGWLCAGEPSICTDQGIIQIDFSGFESGGQGWIFGGADGDRDNTRSSVDDSGTAGGAWSAHLQDDSTSSKFFKNFDFTGGYDYVNVLFDYYPEGIDPAEYIELFCDTVQVWNFTNGDHGQDTWFSTAVRINTVDCNFDSTVQIRFNGNPGLSTNADDIWVDGINITGVLI